MLGTKKSAKKMEDVLLVAKRKTEKDTTALYATRKRKRESKRTKNFFDKIIYVLHVGKIERTVMNIHALIAS